MSTEDKKKLRFLLLIAVPALAALIAGVVYLTGGRYVDTDNAYVKADKVPISADVSGSVVEVLVQENETVSAGQPLFRIDPAGFDIAVSRAEAKLQQVKTDLATLKAGFREKQSEIAQARTKQAFARKDFERQSYLAAKSIVSASKLDDAKQVADLAGQQIVTLQDDLKRIEESLGGSVETPIEEHPSYKAAQAELEQARLDQKRTTVLAPVAGTVSKPPKQGQYVQAGGIAMALVASGTLWVEANFTETDLTYVHPGQAVAVQVDTYPGKDWKGTVESLSPATGAEFSVIPAQNATGNWVKIAQRVPVRIKLEDASGMPELRAGLSAVVEIDTGHKRRFLGLAL